MNAPSATDSGAAGDLGVRVDKALIERRRVLGIDRRMAGIVIAAAMLSLGVLRTPWVGIGIPVLYCLAWWLMRKDPDWLDVYLQYRTQGDHYEPRPHGNQRYNLRPVGFGRGFPCY